MLHMPRYAALALMLLATQAAAVELVPLFTEAHAGDLLAWRLDQAPAEWLTLDVDKTPRLIVSGPDNKTWQRPAFVYQEAVKNPNHEAMKTYQVDGPQSLQVRHTPRSAGVHHWQLVDPAGKELAKGDLTVAGSARPVGPLRISADNARLLAFADGAIFIPIGPNLAWANGPDKLEQFERWFAALHGSRGNHARIWCSSWCGQIEGDKPDQYRLDHAWLLDRILALARKFDVKLTVVFDNHHDFLEGKAFPYGNSNAERIEHFLSANLDPAYVRRLKYFLARYGADDTVLAWELFNELDLACTDGDTCVGWMSAAGSLLGKLDQDHRLRTCSWSAADWNIAGKVPEMDLIQIHAYILEWADVGDEMKKASRDGIGILASAAERAYPIGRPFCFSEVGYQGAGSANPGNDLDVDGLLTRQQAWAGFMLGGYGSGMSWWWDSYIHPLNLWQQYYGLATVLQRMNWHDAQMAPILPNKGSVLRVLGWQSPTQALIWPHVRKDTWYSLYVDRKSRPQLRAPIPVTFNGFKRNAFFTIRSLNMISAQEVRVEHAQADNDGALVLNVPEDCVDLVMQVELTERK